MDSDHQEGRCLCRLNVAYIQSCSRKGRVRPGLFFANGLLYKAHNVQRWSKRVVLKTLMTRNPRDFWTGLLYIFFGSSAIIIARDYNMGTAVKMGPAYFPTILGGVLLVIGAISVIRSFIVPGAPIGGFAFKGLVLVSVSVLVFGFVVRGAGLVVALPLLVIISAFASSRFRWRPTLIMVAGLTIFCVLVFVKGLGIPLPIIGPWFGG